MANAPTADNAVPTLFLYRKKRSIKIKRFIKRYNVEEQIRRYPTAAHFVDMVCPFRDEVAKTCTIYPVRPEICRTFICCHAKEEIERNRKELMEKHPVIDVRAVFFNGSTGLNKEFTEHLIGLGNKLR